MSFQARHSLPHNLPSNLTAPYATIFCNMHYNGNRLLIAGGDLNYNGIDREGTVMYYENGTWYNFNEDGIIKQTNVKYTNTKQYCTRS